MLYNKRNLSVADCCAADDPRFVINAVRFTQHGTEATDGKLLARVSMPEAQAKEFPEVGQAKAQPSEYEFLVDRKACKEIARTILKSKGYCPHILEHAYLDAAGSQKNNSVRFLTTDMEITKEHRIHKVDGIYPHTKGVWPCGIPEARVTLDPKLLMKVLKAAADFGKTVRLVVFGEDQPILIKSRADDGQRFKAIIMPVTTERQ